MRQYRVVLALVALLIGATRAQQSIEYQVGTWTPERGSIHFSVIKNGKYKSIRIFAIDENVIESVFFEVSRNELLKMRALIDKTLNEYARR